jgi:hypothetical protein
MSYPAFAKIPRLERGVVITEKIDGTNGLIFVVPAGSPEWPEQGEDLSNQTGVGLFAGSRNRWLRRGKSDDNMGFAAFVAERANDIIERLGPGLHYGEFWGKGIQRGYGLDRKVFSLFNVSRWHWMTNPQAPQIPDVTVVPTVGIHATMSSAIRMLPDALEHLRRHGSAAAPGFMDPEGIVLFHSASQSIYKYTLDGDGQAADARRLKHERRSTHDLPPMSSAPDATGHP